jgi:hypothetical protein
MATFVLTIVFAAIGAILLFFAWAASTEPGSGARTLLIASASCFALAAWGVSDMARAQDGHRENHDWLSKLRTNNGQGSCCSGDEEHGDCRIAQARQRPDGQWEAFYLGTRTPGSGIPLYWDWFIIPPGKILPDEKNKVPLHSWICEQNAFVYCFLKGGGGT